MIQNVPKRHPDSHRRMLVLSYHEGREDSPVILTGAIVVRGTDHCPLMLLKKEIEDALPVD